MPTFAAMQKNGKVGSFQTFAATGTKVRYSNFVQLSMRVKISPHAIENAGGILHHVSG
jgi:hypothetical protein